MPFISYAQNYEDVTLWRALKDVAVGFYIDVGACDPDKLSVTRAFSERGWRGINLEPVQTLHADLQSRRPRDINLCVAAGSRAGTADFFEVGTTGLSTMDRTMAERHATEGFTVERRPVQIETLATICKEHAPATIHFLKLDCEGGERDALLGADFSRFRPWIVVVEATEALSQTPNHELWESILLDAGYEFAWFDGLNRFYVAAEHSARLTPLIAIPPNVFDDFIRASEQPPAPPALLAADTAPAFRPAVLTIEDRIALAQRCRDCDPIPKVAAAGQVRTEPDGTRVQIMHNGLKVLADAYSGPWMTRLITVCEGHHEPQEERLFHDAIRALPPDATMIELGGNWSYYSAWFLQGASRRRAIVLEPDPLNRASGEATMRLNGLHATFIAGTAGRASTAPVSFLTERSGSLLLPGYSVQQLMDEHGVEHLDMLHCDTQGAETAVLEGCRPLFRAGRVTFVFVSTHVHQISGDPLTHYRCLDLLQACGGVIEVEHDAYESFSGDGLIVARFGRCPEGWQPVPISRARRSESLFRDPCFDLAQAMDSYSARPSVPSQLITALERHGEVQFGLNSLVGTAAMDGTKLFRADGTATGFLIYGPYVPCAAGHYECTFLVQTEDTEAAADRSDLPLLEFDIALDSIAQPAVQTCTRAGLKQGGFVPLSFRFSVPHEVGALETRLALVQPVAIAIVAAVALRRLGAIDDADRPEAVSG